MQGIRLERNLFAKYSENSFALSFALAGNVCRLAGKFSRFFFRESGGQVIGLGKTREDIHCAFYIQAYRASSLCMLKSSFSLIVHWL